VNVKTISSITGAVIFGVLAACANPTVVQLSPDTYLISKTDKAGIFGNASAMKAKAINEANSFAQSKGKIAIPISTQDSAMAIGHFASFDYQFRLVDPNSPDAKSTPLIQRPDVVVQKNERANVTVENKDVAPKQPDVYTELIKLDDLRKRGIISDSEFESQKAKILSGSANQ
jgi:hypothetical protein